MKFTMQEPGPEEDSVIAQSPFPGLQKTIPLSSPFQLLTQVVRNNKGTLESLEGTSHQMDEIFNHFHEEHGARQHLCRGWRNEK